MPNPVSRTWLSAQSATNIGRLDVLVDEAMLVCLPQCVDDADRKAQKAPHFHWRAKKPIERLAARILKHQYGPTGFMYEVQRPYRPRTIQFVPQRVFVSEVIEDGGRRVLCGGQHGQHGISVAVWGTAPYST